MKRGFVSLKTAVLSLAMLSALGIGALGFAKAGASTVQDCTQNSIIVCGEQTPGDFINRVRSNNPSDLTTVYSDFGLVSSDYSKFVSSARMGMAYRDGTIVVDGQIVATDAWSIGRNPFSYSSAMSIGGKTYYRSANNRVLKSDLPVMVMFNDKGEMQFAVMTACGNPTTGHKVTPSYSCDLLQKSVVSGKRNTYQFTTKASAANNAKVVKVVYDFGDGTTATQSNPTTPVQHTYAQSGTYTARVTVYVSLPGNQTVTTTSTNCETKITIAPPFQSCESLAAFTLDKEKRQFRFVATTNQGNGSELQNASFAFGDGSNSGAVNPATANTVVADHTYSNDGTYNIVATVNFNTIDGVKSVSCTTQISPQVTPPPAPPVTPPAPVLPNTGAGNVLGLFAGASIAGGIGYRLYLSRKLPRGL